MNKGEKGRLGEDAACDFLQKKGFRLLGRNYRALRCEIDLIMLDGETTVFVEVKARTPSRFGSGREAVTIAKQRNIYKAALSYAAERDMLEAPMRFDVVEVDLNSGGVVHIENAFSV